MKISASTALASAFLCAGLCLCPSAWASNYYRRVIFDNSLTSDAYFYSWGAANGPSFLALRNHHLPVDGKTFLTPPNALRLEWQSQPGGAWETEIRVEDFRNRNPELQGHFLYFWCFAPQAIAARDLPMWRCRTRMIVSSLPT
jgi:exo beta-1,2-glucooligosaccharide sophorohydrolase (non-reducing end)